jgi:cation diffusion facilitator CzcD-associated flavoprotein CzcO
VILEASQSLGGVWAKHRLYPGLKSNNMLGTYEYPDFPMDTETFGVKPGEHIPGTVLHEYLTKYAEKFDILNKIRYNVKVTVAEHQDGPEGGWVLTLQDTAADSPSGEQNIFARKLVVATGLTSEAFLPEFAGQQSFGKPIFHGKDFLQHADTLDSAKTVTVFGGTKSAWDAVYAYATKGIKVNWVIRGMSYTALIAYLSSGLKRLTQSQQLVTAQYGWRRHTLHRSRNGWRNSSVCSLCPTFAPDFCIR